MQTSGSCSARAAVSLPCGEGQQSGGFLTVVKTSCRHQLPPSANSRYIEALIMTGDSVQIQSRIHDPDHLGDGQ